MTDEGLILVEGDPSSIHHVGLVIPELVEAHAYALCDAEGTGITNYEPSRERLGMYSDHYWLTRYQVVGQDLVRFVSHCFEESTYDSPSTSEPKRTDILTGLQLLRDREG